MKMNAQNPPSSSQDKKLLDLYREALRTKHYARRTEDTYVGWVRQYILYHHKRHPREMGVAEINQFITHLAVEKNVAASTQNPCTEPVEVKPSALSCSSIATSSTWNWMKPP